MTKLDLVELYARKHRITKRGALQMLESAMQLVGSAILKDGRFHWPEFGTFMVRSRKARNIRNPQTNGIMRLPRMRTIGFRPSRSLKSRLVG